MDIKKVVLRTGVQLIELSLWTALNNLAGSKMKERGNSIIRDFGNGIKYGASKLKKDK